MKFFPSSMPSVCSHLTTIFIFLLLLYSIQFCSCNHDKNEVINLDIVEKCFEWYLFTIQVEFNTFEFDLIWFWMKGIHPWASPNRTEVFVGLVFAVAFTIGIKFVKTSPYAKFLFKLAVISYSCRWLLGKTKWRNPRLALYDMLCYVTGYVGRIFTALNIIFV